jgi:hypothetical protein
VAATVVGDAVSMRLGRRALTFWGEFRSEAAASRRTPKLSSSCPDARWTPNFQAMNPEQWLVEAVLSGMRRSPSRSLTSAPVAVHGLSTSFISAEPISWLIG